MKRYPSLAVLCGLLVVFTLARGGERPAYKLSDAEKQILETTNQERKDAKLPPLRHNPLLSRVAHAHSENMARQDKQDHILDGMTHADRIRRAGYKFRTAGENIATGQGVTLADVLRGWMKSKGHRANILSSKYTEIGVGVAQGKDGKVFYTQVFAAPLAR